MIWPSRLLLCPTEPTQPGTRCQQQRAAGRHQREIEPRERQAAALDGSRAERLLNRALHADVRVALECHISLGTLLAGYAMAILFWIISPTPQGLGIVEGAMTLALKLGWLSSVWITGAPAT